MTPLTILAPIFLGYAVAMAIAVLIIGPIFEHCHPRSTK